MKPALATVAALAAVAVLPEDAAGALLLGLIVVGLVAFGRRLTRRPAAAAYPRVTVGQREQIVYALGAFDHMTNDLRSIKFGVTLRGVAVRHAEIEDREHQVVSVKVLATGPGGEPREQAIMRRLDRWRYPRSEWFDASVPVLRAVGGLERPTALGKRVLAGVDDREANEQEAT